MDDESLWVTGSRKGQNIVAEITGNRLEVNKRFMTSNVTTVGLSV